MAIKKALFEQVAERLIAQLESGTSPFQKPWSDVPETSYIMPFNPTTGKAYKGINNFWLSMQQREDPRWLTFKQAEANGWSINKGAHGTMINFIKTQDYRKINDKNGKPVLDLNGKPLRAIVHLDRPVITFAWVFNADQVTGIPVLEKAIEEKLAARNWSNIEAAEKIIENSGAKVKHGGNDAYYRPGRDYIQMPKPEQFDSAPKYYSTLLHELGHWTGHESRLDRSMINQFGTENYAREELRAEISSLLIGSEIGIGHDFSQHAAYVASWIKVLKDDPFEIHRASSDAQKIFDFIMAFEQKRKVEQAVALDVSLGLQAGQVIAYKSQQFRVNSVLSGSGFEMENLTTGKNFKLSKTDKLYQSLIDVIKQAGEEPAREVAETRIKQHSIKR